MYFESCCFSKQIFQVANLWLNSFGIKQTFEQVFNTISLVFLDNQLLSTSGGQLILLSVTLKEAIGLNPGFAGYFGGERQYAVAWITKILDSFLTLQFLR